jgi:hypothetical protein
LKTILKNGRMRPKVRRPDACPKGHDLTQPGSSRVIQDRSGRWECRMCTAEQRSSNVVTAKLCSKGHDLNAPGGRLVLSGGGTSTQCRLCRLDYDRKRKRACQSKTAKFKRYEAAGLSEDQFVPRWLKLTSELERCATHWERDAVQKQMDALQAQRRKQPLRNEGGSS